MPARARSWAPTAGSRTTRSPGPSRADRYSRSWPIAASSSGTVQRSSCSMVVRCQFSNCGWPPRTKNDLAGDVPPASWRAARRGAPRCPGATSRTAAGSSGSRTVSARPGVPSVMRVRAAGTITLARAPRRVQLLGDDHRERGDAGLGGAVVRLARLADEPRRRAGVDDRRGSVGVTLLGPLAPERRGVAGRGEGALEVRAHDEVPVLLGHVHEHAVAHVAGHVDEHVEVAVRVDGLWITAAGRRPRSDDVARVGHGRRRRPPVISSTTAWATPGRCPCRRARCRGRSPRPWRPSADRRSASSRPMPRPPPVTTAIRPSSSAIRASR